MADRSRAGWTDEEKRIERVTRALELALADHGIAFDPVDDAGPVGETLARYLSGTGDMPRHTCVPGTDGFFCTVCGRRLR